MNIPANSALNRIGQIAINVYDVGRATAFYRDVLALPHLFSAGHLSFFNCGGVLLCSELAWLPISWREDRSGEPFPALPSDSTTSSVGNLLFDVRGPIGSFNEKLLNI